MATKQGMCKNCGSLIIFDDRNENCECIFCHCIFPGAEAVQILENPDDYTFANEEIAESSESTHYYATKVNPDMIESAVARDRAMKAKEDSGSIKPSDFEISPNDVKAPAKLKAILIGATALLIIIIIAVLSRSTIRGRSLRMRSQTGFPFSRRLPASTHPLMSPATGRGI